MASALSSIDQQISHEQVATVFKVYSTGVVGGAIAAVVLIAILSINQAVDPKTGMIWASIIVAIAIVHLALGVAYRRAGEAGCRLRRWPIAFTFCAFGEGAGWGWATVALAIDNHFDHQLVILLVALGIAGGAGAAFGPYRPAFVAIFVPTTFPYVIASLGATNRLEATSWPLMIVYMVSVLSLGLASNRASRRAIELRLLSETLAADLKQQKDIAESANLAKSTFLAAASHDLRQPVHALGLFAGALRELDLPAEGDHLVARIEASVDALDGLFSALLDISRLDAGVVEVNVQPFALGPLIDRICTDYAAEAVLKNIVVRVRPTRAIVASDPVLVERILRNVVANAVRHTARGRILVTCRPCGGAIRVEVRDTGPGIAPAEQSRIFEEYYQIGNVERDRTRGLGLGLAIVRRLTDLLGSRLTLHSLPGRGTCFGIELPLATAGAESVAMSPATPAAGEGGLIVVVDDESDIREAMDGLLTQWGFAVVAVPSYDAAMDQLAECREQPRLLICDYRLRGGENGIDVVERLRLEYNETIPAMLITGDTAPPRLIEARASGLFLLHKPVSNAKLRATIATMLAEQIRDGD